MKYKYWRGDIKFSIKLGRYKISLYKVIRESNNLRDISRGMGKQNQSNREK